jgi:subtilase family serine protease
VTFQRPTTPITLPAALQGVVLSVRGLSTEPRFRPHYMRAPTAITTGQSANAAHRANATPADGATPPTFHTPGTYTVQDLATRNNITPLYTAGYDGTGKTIGIMTFASYTATDATTYWSGIGINHTGSVTVVNVGGTIGTSGGGETALDVEQSGGIAPGANIIVYEAPNTSAGEIALYTRAVTDNIADTLSISWGEAEADYSPADLVALNQIFMQSAAQGVPISASSGDSGAYDINGEGYTYPNYTPTLSVDFPAASPYILAAGGTTLPGEQDFYNSAGTAIVGSVTIPQERPWGWDYLQTVAETKLGYSESLYYADLFPVGGGGGVSIQYSVPSYQAGLPGVRTSMPGQLLFCIKNSTTNTSTGLIGCTAGNAVTGEAPFTANFAGRNVPDVSLNADPDTGYVLYSVSDGGTGWTSGYGGTSFVAPELNGIFALISQKTGGRLGWVHPQMYTAFQNLGYGAGSPFRPITSATNLFWPATNSYNPATGLGTLDAANLAAIF